MINGGQVHGSPVWQQPGGPGTPVYPQQQPGECMAMFNFPCGHWSNHIEVEVRESAPGVRSALLSCPLCTYLARVLTPASLYQDPENPILLV